MPRYAQHPLTSSIATTQGDPRACMQKGALRDMSGATPTASHVPRSRCVPGKVHERAGCVSRVGTREGHQLGVDLLQESCPVQVHVGLPFVVQVVLGVKDITRVLVTNGLLVRVVLTDGYLNHCRATSWQEAAWQVEADTRLAHKCPTGLRIA